MSLGNSFILFFIAFIGWSLAVGLVYFIVYLKRENTSLKRALLDKHATRQSSDLKDRLVEQMKIAHNRIHEEVNGEIEDVKNEILQAQSLINQTINDNNKQINNTSDNNEPTEEDTSETTIQVNEEEFEQTLESYGFDEEKAFKIKH